VTLYTVGHGTRPIEELVEVLRDAGVTRVVDVRRFPGSRRNPQFARDELAHTLPAAGITYEWQGETLGGRRHEAEHTRHPALHNAAFRAYADHMDSDEFRHALHALLDEAAAEPTAVMCAETLWWRCHRRLIADASTLEGVEVLHLGMGEPQPHVRTSGMHADAQGRPVYDGSP
jgi:uncharacterized protein (DUF488 family)